MKFITTLKYSAIGLMSLLLIGCEQTEQDRMLRQAVAIESSDECHLCGMVIAEYPGPKGESFQGDGNAVVKFCSTRDMFSYILQPENSRQVREVYVHDMSQTPWHKPEDDYFINAKDAWFVVGSNQTGAMGKTLASFSKQQDAKAFSERYGGQVYDYESISIDIL